MTKTYDKSSVTKASSLSYDRERDRAPKLSAKGRGKVAEKIIEVAKLHNIPIHKDEDLAEILDKVEIEQEVPLEVYAVVAEVFSYIYKVNQQKSDKFD